jgi:hypothetical protein
MTFNYSYNKTAVKIGGFEYDMVSVYKIDCKSTIHKRLYLKLAR